MKLLPTSLLLAAATLVAASSVHAADSTWNGSVNESWHTAGNWTPSVIPGGTNGPTADRAIFDGVGSQNAVTFGNLVGGTSPNSVGGTSGFGGILVTGNQTSALSINSSSTASRNFRFAANAGIAIESGAGAFSMGTSGMDFQLVFQGVGSIPILKNDSSNKATLGDKISILHGGNQTTNLNFAGSGDWDVASVIQGANMQITKIGTGTTTFSGANSYAGGTAINGGILAISKNNSLGTGSVTFDGGTLRVNNAAFTSGTATLANTLSVAEGKTGLLDLVGTGSAGNDLTLNTGAITVDGTLKITRSTGANGTTNVGSLFSGSGVLEVGDTNSGLTIGSNGNGRLWVRNNNAFADFHGSVHILSNGNLALFGASTVGAGGQLVNGNNVTIDAGGYLSLIDSRTSTIGNLNGAGTIVRNNATGTAVLKIASGDFSGTINQTALGNSLGGIIRIEKTGDGTLTLNGANSYSGTTTISGGTLLANNTTGSATGTGAVSVDAGARLGGTGFVTGTVNVTGALRGGDGTTASGTLTVGNVTLAAGSVIELALGASGAHSSLHFNGTESFQSGQVFSFLDLGATTGTYAGLISGVTSAANIGTWTISNEGWIGTFTLNGTNVDLNLTAVPEPSTYGLIGAGALAAVAFVRRRRKHAGAVAA